MKWSIGESDKGYYEIVDDETGQLLAKALGTANAMNIIGMAERIAELEAQKAASDATLQDRNAELEGRNARLLAALVDANSDRFHLLNILAKSVKPALVI